MNVDPQIDSETQAFIHQQILDFEPFLKDLGPMSLAIEKKNPPQTEKESQEKNQPAEFRVSLKVTTQAGELQFVGLSENFIEAFLEAKTQALSAVTQIHNVGDFQPDRDHLVLDMAQRHPYLH